MKTKLEEFEINEAGKTLRCIIEQNHIDEKPTEPPYEPNGEYTSKMYQTDKQRLEHEVKQTLQQYMQDMKHIERWHSQGFMDEYPLTP
jgi:hypothetical protein